MEIITNMVQVINALHNRFPHSVPFPSALWIHLLCFFLEGELISLGLERLIQGQNILVVAGERYSW
jgi:hypothetical protein